MKLFMQLTHMQPKWTMQVAAFSSAAGSGILITSIALRCLGF